MNCYLGFVASHPSAFCNSVWQALTAEKEFCTFQHQVVRNLGLFIDPGGKEYSNSKFMALKETLKFRKQSIEERLCEFGINEYSITFLRYLMFDDKAFATPYDVGCRIMIIYAVCYVIGEPQKRQAVCEWLKAEKLWEHLGYNEQEYLNGSDMEEEQINDLSWQIEAAYILAWSLNLTKEKPSPMNTVTDKQMEDFYENVAPLGDNLTIFLSGLTFRNTTEIFDENIFYELTTGYFRDLYIHSKKDATNINRTASFQRHKALNWLRRFSGVSEWDETDMST